jgi:hypothetical protein
MVFLATVMCLLFIF